MKEILGRINKIQQQSDIATQNAENFRFPRVKLMDSNESSNIELPTAQEIFDEIEQCKAEAIQYAKKNGLIGIKKSKNVDISCKVLPYVPKKKTKSRKQNHTLSSDEKNHLLSRLKVQLLLSSGSIKSHANIFANEPIPEKCPYVEVDKNIINKKKRLVLKKTFVCWLLRKHLGKLSSDRLQRVQLETRAQRKHRENTSDRRNKIVKPYRIRNKSNY